MPDTDVFDSEKPDNPDIHLEDSPDNFSIITKKFLIFKLLGKQYCFPSGIIAEITRFDALFPLPLLPSYLPGIINRFSIPYALFDIGSLFFNTPSPRNKILIFKEEIDRIAVLVDDISDIADINENDILYIDSENNLYDQNYFITASFKWNNTDVFVLDPRLLLNHVTGDALFKRNFFND